MYILMSSVSEVLVDYLRSQKQRLRECQRCVEAQRLDSEMAASAVETIRKNVSTIRTLKTRLNAIWDPAVVAFSLMFSLGSLHLLVLSFHERGVPRDNMACNVVQLLQRPSAP
ncbi:hypothetical protein MTO96_014759 [Rhipicephalus appendiculatus]